MTEYHQGSQHNHTPCGRWPEIQKDPQSPGAPFGLETLCKNSDPETLVWFAKQRIWDNPLGLRHINWYLKGKGADLNEDKALKIVLEKDDGVRSAIGRRLPVGRKTGKFADNFFLEQKHYGLDDARTAWGGIDRFDFEADFDAGNLHVWFKDRYEWHPYYPGLYSVQSDDFARETNCLHAAFVEMKLKGAADFWMVGEATVPLKGIVGYTLGGNSPDW